MRIAVIGAGLAGVTTAYELARDGHEVTVFERRGGIAAEGSFAPAGVAAPGLWLAHAATGTDHGLEPLAARAADLPWLYRRWRTARRGDMAARLRAMSDLARFNLERLATLTSTHQLEYERHTGVLAVIRSARDARRAHALLDEHAGLSLPVRWLDASQARQAEPGLNPALALEGALHWPAGEAANVRQFAHALKATAQQAGACFHLRHEVVAIAASPGAAPAVDLQIARSHEFGDTALAAHGVGDTTVPDDPNPQFDAAVLCSADAAARLLSPQRACPRVIPARVYSVTAPLREPVDAGERFAPTGAVIDPAARTAIGRMGERVRAAGLAAFGLPETYAGPAALAPLYRSLEGCFPGAARSAKGLSWVGRQTSTADGLPLAGGSGIPGVWLHCAHGANRWAWVAATARLLADQLAGRATSLDAGALSPARLR